MARVDGAADGGLVSTAVLGHEPEHTDGAAEEADRLWGRHDRRGGPGHAGLGSGSGVVLAVAVLPVAGDEAVDADPAGGPPGLCAEV